MKKHELIDEVARRSGMTQAMSRVALDALRDAVLAAVANGQDVMLAGLGKLHVARRGPRVSRHMVTGERMELPAGRMAKLRPSTSLTAAADSAP